MLDFIADNYLWFIVLGTVLLAIALILLFTRKKPIKENVGQPNTDVNNAQAPQNIGVTENTEVLDIVEDTPQTDAVTNAFEQPVEEVKSEIVEEMDPFAFEPQVNVENAQNTLDKTVVEPLTVNEETTPNNDFVVEEVTEPNVTEEIVFDEPVEETTNNETFVVPTTLDNNVPNENLSNQSIDENSINVGNVVMPEKTVNTDNVQVNNEQEDIWKF